MEKGTLYGVSVGPGDPQLMTLKAVEVIQKCPVVAAPRTKEGNSLALEIAKGAVDLEGKEFLLLDFLMTKDPARLEESHSHLAGQLMAVLDRGQDVALLNLGDISVYSTFSYMQKRLEKAGYPVKMIPGVTSFCAVAAELGVSLTEMDKPLHIIPAGHQGLEESLSFPGTRVLMKTGKALPQVKAALQKADLTRQAKLVQNCGLPNQKICLSLEELEEDVSYFTTIVIGEEEFFK